MTRKEEKKKKKKEKYCKQQVVHEEGVWLSKSSCCERFFKHAFALSTNPCK